MYISLNGLKDVGKFSFECLQTIGLFLNIWYDFDIETVLQV